MGLLAVSLPPLSESQVGPLLCPVITAGRFVGASGKRDTRSTSSPGFLQQLTRCAWGGGRRLGLLPGVPRSGGGGRERARQEPAGLDGAEVVRTG